MDPVNINPLLSVMFQTSAKMQQALENGQITVSEAIDIAASAAHATAREMGVADTVIATNYETSEPKKDD